MLDGENLRFGQAVTTPHLQQNRGAGLLLVAAEKLAFGQHQMHPRRPDIAEGADSAGDLSFQRPQAVDIQYEVAGAKGFRAVEKFIPHGSARRQAFLGHRKTQSQHLIGRHQDLIAVAAQLIGYPHVLELRDDLTAVGRIEISEQQGHGGGRQAGCDIDEKGDETGGHEGHDQQPHGAKATQCLKQFTKLRTDEIDTQAAPRVGG